MSTLNPEVDQYLSTGCMRCPLGNTPACKVKKWEHELGLLRKIVLSSGLTEKLKWGVPTYTNEKNKNVVLIHGFKEYCALMFIKGSLMKDPKGILIQQTENVQGGRQVRFTKLSEIKKLQTTLEDYLREAIELEKAGKKVEYKKVEEFKVAEEFASAMKKNPALKKAFQALTPGRQRGYLLYFAGAKQSATRAARVEKCTPMILAGKGLQDDLYKK